MNKDCVGANAMTSSHVGNVITKFYHTTQLRGERLPPQARRHRLISLRNSHQLSKKGQLAARQKALQEEKSEH